MPTVADLVVAGLVPHTDHVFGVGGANIEDVYDAVSRCPGLTGVVAKHEFGAATMADGYARLTGRLGCVVATSGGGALNLVAALGESFESGVPVLALVGQPPTGLEGRGAFQDTSGLEGTLDARTVFGAVSRYCRKVTRADELPQLLGEAIAAALDLGGPAVLLLPKDVQQAACDAPVPAVTRTTRTVDETLGRAISLIDTAPGWGPVVVIAGAEVARSDARAELRALATALGAHVALTPEAKDVFPNADPAYVGVAGVMGHPGIADLVAEASLCLVVGTPLGSTDAAGLVEVIAECPRVVHLGNRAPFVAPALSVAGPLREVLSRIVDGIAPRGTAPPPPSRRAYLPAEPPATGLGYREVVERLTAHLGPGADVFADAGNTGAAVIHHLDVPEDGRFVVALGMGGMGYAFGAGVGSALGRGRRTWVIAGDGSYFMHGHEVHTAVQHQAPVTFVVFDNSAHGMCVVREQVYFAADYSFNRFAPAAIGASVAALHPGLPAYSVASAAELDAALLASRSAAGPVFISVVCSADEIPPFRPFLQEMTP